MALVFPVRLDEEVLIIDRSGNCLRTKVIESNCISGIFCVVNQPFQRRLISGYDSSMENNGKGLRVTNLAYIENFVVFKNCPACLRNFPFDSYSTRTTNERRDQSDCEECRRAAANT
ncbi:hypothetical protein [Vibrio metschnikovii]|uniref:hypothetical protein n=1 Tax=Vibrio metschnikovii TaxID=28172 RepID=UPI00164B2A07|nr:hypothetical protein [Vibrio metschnikovii]MBC5833160.1 hypothetical protein [Vibrio metschnikovii]